MQGITVTAQRGYLRTLIGDNPVELGERCGIFEHREPAVCIARIIAGAKFHSVDVERLQLGKDRIQRELRQQGVKRLQRA
jgi:hypothetical protein